MKNGRGSLLMSALKTIRTWVGTMTDVHPVCSLSGLRQAVVVLVWQSPLPPSALESLYQLNSLTSSATVSTSSPTSMGCRGMPRAAPTGRMFGSRDASSTIQWMWSVLIAVTR